MSEPTIPQNKIVDPAPRFIKGANYFEIYRLCMAFLALHAGQSFTAPEIQDRMIRAYGIDVSWIVWADVLLYMTAKGKAQRENPDSYDPRYFIY
jgi:hypothetical protein